jgi:large subunit ribosomal protein L9
MKVLLLQDVYKLGRAGDVKKVANGYGRNYLIPHGFAVLATPEAVKQAERIREKATIQRKLLNQEMEVVAERISGLVLSFSAKASETDRLYGSITTQMIIEAVNEKANVEITRRQVDSQPLRTLGEFLVPIRLTVDLIPDVKVIVYREGEALTVSEDEAESEVEDVPEGESVESAEVEDVPEGESVESAEVEEIVVSEIEEVKEEEMISETEVESTEEVEEVALDEVEIEADENEESITESPETEEEE